VKIGIVLPNPYEWYGGTRSHVLPLAAHLRRRGHEVRILAPRGPVPGEDEPDLIRLGRTRNIRWNGTQIDLAVALGRHYREMIEALRRECFDLLHFHTVWNPFLLPQILLAAGPAARVATFHDAGLRGGWEPLGHLLMASAAWFLGRWFLDAMIGVSPVTCSYLTRFYRGPVWRIPNGIETARFAPGRVEPLPQYRDGRLNILFLGRLEERKGVRILLEAYARLRARHAEVRLLLAGEGYLRAEIESWLARRRLPDVHLLGRVSDEDRCRLFATCDIFCSPAPYGESFGIVLLEAMASGKPAVGAANAGYRSVLTGLGQRLLVEPGSVAALEARLAELIENPDLRHQLGAWGLAEARQYDWSRLVGAVEEVYRQALARRRGRVPGEPARRPWRLPSRRPAGAGWRSSGASG
jgi:phosphatidylinositol alpha-mannosyltransferase